MNPWLNESSSMPNNHAGFGPHGDNTMAFLQPPSTINPAQFQNQPFLNGANRTASPAFHNPMYQTNQVIPSKRTREDSIGASPRQGSNAPPGSRSQTPGQPQFSGFNSQQTNGGPPFSNGPTPFQHLQTTNNASPSPTIQQTNFNPPGSAPRVSTASPSPFSPQHGGPQMSPGPPDQNSRVGTPHENQQQPFMTSAGFPQGFNGQQFGPNMGNQGPMGMNPMNMAQQQMHQQGLNAAQRNYQMHMQAQARQLQAQAQAQMQAQARSANGMPGNPLQGTTNSQINPAEQQNIPNARPSNPEEFLRGLQQFMASRGRSVDMNPVICGRPMPLIRFYASVVKAGGSLKLTKMNQWPALAQQIGFPPPQCMQAGQEMQHYWLGNLAGYETALMTASQRQRLGAQAQAQNQMASMSQAQVPDPSAANQQRVQPDIMAMKLNGQLPTPAHTGSTNGYPSSMDPRDTTPTHRSSLSRQLDAQQLDGMPMPSPTKRPGSGVVKNEPETESTMPIRKPIEDPFKPEIMPPSRYHGPIIVEEMFAVGEKVLELKPVQPTLRELGVIDIHALTMAIKSGMHAETRVALDTLVSLSTEPSLQLSLQDCEDLMDTLIDYAQVQVDTLAEHSVEVTDDMSLSSYEEVIRACRAEAEALQDVPQFGSLAYDLDRAANHLICITTLIRNFSFYEANFAVLGQPEVVQVLTNVMRQLGTKEMPLRTHRNTLDFMKDVVIYLSNLSTSLALPGKQEALCLLHFLLAFAPTPQPVLPNSDKVSFAMYNPNLHKYMPAAVDSLAKLLARDEPNRIYYKSIFSADANSNPSYELLTRTFGLAIAPIPAATPNTRATVEARKPFLLQGMLAAEILVGLAPGSEHSLARSWLESEDGFAGTLLRLVSHLSSQSVANRLPPQPGRGMPPQHEPDASAYGALTHRSIAVLKVLVQKAKVVDSNGDVQLPANVTLKKETLLGAMIQRDMEPSILRQLCAYGNLGDL